MLIITGYADDAMAIDGLWRGMAYTVGAPVDWNGPMPMFTLRRPVVPHLSYPHIVGTVPDCSGCKSN